MYCIECGAKNEDRAKFCMVCGSPMSQPESAPAAVLIPAQEEPSVVQEVVSPMPVPEAQPVTEVPIPQEQPKVTLQSKSNTGILCRILGVVLLLCAVVPHFLDSQLSPLFNVVAQYSAYSVSAYSVMLSTWNIGTLFSGFAYIALLVTGMGLLLNRQGLKKLLIVCLVACSVHTVCLLAVAGWITSAPGSVVSVFGNSNMVEAAEQLLQSVPAVREAFVDQLLMDILPLLIALAAAIIAFVFAARSAGEVRLSGKCDRGAASLCVLWPVLLIYNVFARASDTIAFDFFGSAAISANSCAENAISSELSDILWLAGLLAVLGGLWLRKRKTWQLWLPLAGTVALAVAIMAPQVLRFLELRGIPMDVMAMAHSLTQVRLITTVLETGILIYWYLVSARGQLPAWLQPILVLARSVAYILTNVLVVAILRSYELALLLSTVHACFVIIAVALPVSMARARRTRQTIQ